MIRQWHVQLRKEHTLEDLRNGAIGIGVIKVALLRCEECNIATEIDKLEDYKGFDIHRIQDWGLMQAVQTAEMIEWIMNH